MAANSKTPPLVTAAIIVAAIVLPIGGILGINAINSAGKPDQGSTSQPSANTPRCLTVSADAADGIQWGLDDKGDGAAVITTAAVQDPADPTAWLVTAELAIPGTDGATGIWRTNQNPTGPGTFAYTSADAIAAEFSSYVKLDTGTNGFTTVRDCMN